MRLLAAVIALTLFAWGCTSGVSPSPATPVVRSTTAPPAPSTTHAVTTTTTTASSHDMGLYRVDPATLAPIPGSEPLTTGDWISGELSPNGEWLALHVWIDTQPETDLIQVIHTPTGEIVTETPGRLADLVGIGDDGAVYQMSHLSSRGFHLRMLVPGAARFETVFDDLPAEFVAWGPSALLGSGRAAWFGGFGGGIEEQVAGIVVADLETGSSREHRLEDVSIGAVLEMDLDGWSVSETVVPAVVWDRERDRALVVHGDQDAVTVLDLVTGDAETHEWSPAASLLDRLMAWLIPPARAKGPSSYGVSRNATLGPSGDTLYVGTSVSDVVVDGDDWFIESTPQGVSVVDTQTWEVVDRLDVPVSEVAVSPDGGYLVATGATWTESLSTSHVQAEGVHVFEMGTHEPRGHFDPPDAWPDIQFSPDGGFMYIGAIGGQATNIIVDLGQMAEVGRSHGSLFGAAGLLTLRP